MTILFFGRYDPGYARNAVLLDGLRLAGARVIECNVPASARFWTIRLLWKYMRLSSAYDVMLVAFPGQEVMLLARMITRKPIIFDGFTSHYEGYVQDRRLARPGSLRARWYRFVDRAACTSASVVLTDTRAHAAYYTDTFGIPRQKMIPVLLGTTMRPLPDARPESDEFVVHFHGNNIPLQGMQYIWQAVRMLAGEGIRFQMIGPFDVPEEVRDRVDHIRRVPFEDLARLMAGAHVCLGIFGDTEKTSRVIPNKVYEAVAVGVPVITADTPAIRELFTDSDVCLVKPADGRAIADMVRWTKEHPEERHRMALSAKERLRTRAAPAIVGAQLLYICEHLALRT